MKKFVVGALVVLGLLAIMGTMAVGALLMVSLMARPNVPGNTILEIDFERGTIESIPPDPFAELMLKGVLPLRDVVDALDRAAVDDRVQGLVARIGAGGMGMAHTQEIRDAVSRFRASGKPAVAWGETFGEFASGNGGYYLATAFDEIYLQPSGDVGLTGLIYQSPFLREAFEKLEISPRMDQRYEYKNAMNMYTERSFTEPHREALERLMDSQFDQMVAGIAAGRGLDEGAVRALVDRGPFLGEEAVTEGLVDGLRYRDEVIAMMKERAGARARLLYLPAYLERAERPHRRGETVALVHAHGTVVRGGSGYSPLDGSVIMGSDTVGAALRAAIDDDAVRAILLRVDSPGGSYVASDTIWHETRRAREAGKPVVVSMGNLAASGGYFVSMSADKIVAQPGTITGSIGVLGGKLVTRDFWGKLGITFDEVHTSANATAWSTIDDYSERGYQRFQDSLDRIYDDFTAKVAEGRELPVERVREIARGRIWTGADAKELGLVDEIGGYAEALDLVRETLMLEAEDPLKIRVFPRKRGALEQWLGQEPDSSENAVAVLAAELLRTVQPAVRVLRQAGIGEPVHALETRDVGPRP